MKRTPLFTALLVLGLAACPISASADTFNLGTLTNATVSIGNATGTGTLPGFGNTFTDHWYFSINPYELTGIVTVDLDVPYQCDEPGHIAPCGFEIDPRSVLLTDGTHNWAGVTTSEEVMQINAMLAPGNYDFQVSGTIAGSRGGSYGGTISALAVPEPESYAMMLAGLGLVGLIARRRST